MKQLGFSEGYELLYAIAFGYPDEMPAAKPREVSKVNAARKSKVDDNTAKMQSIKQLGV